MQPVITPAESERLDAASAVPVEHLMERAGLAVSLAAVRMGAVYGRRVIALAGPGNNGGDAYVAARYLRARGVAVEVRALGYPKRDWSPARSAGAAAARAGVPVRPLGDPEACDLVIDGLFGAGFHGALRDPAAAWTDHRAPVLAIDLPSGLHGGDGRVEGPAFRADRTITFGARKVGHLIGEGPDRCGVVEVVDIGLGEPRPELLLCEDGDAPAPPRDRAAHKWSAGTVAVVGGSPGLAGAVALTARGALAAGAGYVRAIVPEAVRAEVALHAGPSVTTWGIPGNRLVDTGAVLAAAERFDVVAVGPGLGLESAGLVGGLLESWDRALVLDADAITTADPAAVRARRGPLLLTPHGGEFRRLTGTDISPGAVADFATDSGAVILAKGSPTFVAGRERWVVTSGGPELATLGTGDVLTGVVAAFVARGLDPETAARSAAHRHGLAGRSLARSGTVTAATLADEMARWVW